MDCAEIGENRIDPDYPQQAGARKRGDGGIQALTHAPEGAAGGLYQATHWKRLMAMTRTIPAAITAS